MYLYENDDYDFFARPRISDAAEFSINFISHEVAENFVAAATSLFQFWAENSEFQLGKFPAADESI